jgi:hypothetical protein
MNKNINKLLKPIKAFVAIILTMPAVYLPFRLQNVYKRMMSLLAYKLKDYKFIAYLVMIQKQEHKGETRDGKEE